MKKWVLLWIKTFKSRAFWEGYASLANPWGRHVA